MALVTGLDGDRLQAALGLGRLPASGEQELPCEEQNQKMPEPAAGPDIPIAAGSDRGAAPGCRPASA
ncbi:biotin carboxylase [Thiohalobacter thiocyanaticus]|uniref:Biotin carboxylase n=1 Tax=Thiohalobacter thiocyanaticus TaxID=585455 RepID=A0A1Z4VMV4_9GAMM|nr:biotin carboxylase [Thiohalobacter thiocyanaticus]